MQKKLTNIFIVQAELKKGSKKVSSYRSFFNCFDISTELPELSKVCISLLYQLLISAVQYSLAESEGRY